MMDVSLTIISLSAVVFGIYWYFFRIPDFTGYVTIEGRELKKYLSPSRLRSLLEDLPEDIWIVDVREEEHFVQGHLPLARNYSYEGMEEWINEIPLDKRLILYCDLSLKTQRVIDRLEANGHTRILNWGKMKRWKYDLVEEDW